MCFAPQLATSKSAPKLRCFVHFDFEMCFPPQRRALFRQLNFQKWSGPGVFCTFWLRNVLRAATACTFSTSQLLKVLRSWGVLYILTSKCASRHNGVLRTWCVLYILTWTCASRHNGVHFFDIATSKSAPKLRCFVHFDFEMCFAPRRRPFFRHLNFQKCSEHEVSLAFSLANVLRATTACTFSSLIWPQIIGKTECFATFPPFRASELLSSDSFSSLIFSLLLFSSLWLFPSLLFICPYCRKFDF